jgi:hypothetical protein
MIIKLPNGDNKFKTCEFYGKGGDNMYCKIEILNKNWVVVDFV